MSGWLWVAAGYGLTAASWAALAWWVTRGLRGQR